MDGPDMAPGSGSMVKSFKLQASGYLGQAASMAPETASCKLQAGLDKAIELG